MNQSYLQLNINNRTYLYAKTTDMYTLINCALNLKILCWIAVFEYANLQENKN